MYNYFASLLALRNEFIDRNNRLAESLTVCICNSTFLNNTKLKL